MTQHFYETLALVVTVVLVVPGTIAIPVFVAGVAFRAAAPYIRRRRRIIR